MASQPEALRRDGVRVVRTSATRQVIWLTVLGMGVVVLVVVAALFGLRVSGRGPIAEAPRRPPTDLAAATPPDASRFVVPPPAPEPVARAGSTAPRPARAVPRQAAGGEPPAKDDEPFTIGDPNERSGLRAFPPMGTKPIKRGIVVPDDFELPPGYVRHFQSTDDGHRLPAILMFSPDYEWVDAQGHPIALPADRIVPPEMAPPGLPIKMLEPVAPKVPPDGRP